MGGFMRRQDRTGLRGFAADRRCSLGSVERLEPRGMLSGIGLTLLPPPPADGVVVAPPTTEVAPLQVSLQVRMPSSAPNGLPVAAVISAVDAAGRPLFSASGSVTVTSSDAAATFPATVQLRNGRALVPVTFRTAGPQTLTVTDALVADRTATASTTVAPPVVAAKLLVMIPPQVRAGMPTTVTALAVDAAGRPAPTFSGTATVTSSDAAASLPMVEVLFKNGRATFPASVTFVNGRATLRVVFGTLGAQTLTATSGSISGTSTTQVGEVTIQRRT